MRAHIIENGKIANTIEADSLDALPGFQLVNAELGGAIGDGWVDGKLIPATSPVVIPQTLSPRQFRQALTKFGFRQQVEDAVEASSNQDLKDWYEFASAFERDHPEVLVMAQQLGFSASQLDQVWVYGASL